MSKTKWECFIRQPLLRVNLLIENEPSRSPDTEVGDDPYTVVDNTPTDPGGIIISF